MRDHARLARPGTRQDQYRPIHSLNASALLRVHFFQEMLHCCPYQCIAPESTLSAGRLRGGRCLPHRHYFKEQEEVLLPLFFEIEAHTASIAARAGPAGGVFF